MDQLNELARVASTASFRELTDDEAKLISSWIDIINALMEHINAVEDGQIQDTVVFYHQETVKHLFCMMYSFLGLRDDYLRITS